MNINTYFDVNCNYHGNLASQPISIKDSDSDVLIIDLKLTEWDDNVHSSVRVIEGPLLPVWWASPCFIKCSATNTSWLSEHCHHLLAPVTSAARITVISQISFFLSKNQLETPYKNKIDLTLRSPREPRNRHSNLSRIQIVSPRTERSFD